MDYSFLLNNSPVIKGLGCGDEAKKMEDCPDVLLSSVLEVDVVQLDPVASSNAIASPSKSIDNANVISLKKVDSKTSASVSKNHEKEKSNRKCSCDDCRKPTISPSNIGRQKDDERNKFKCKICQVTFSQLSLLELHKKQHEARPYVCSVCNDAFAEQHALKVHQKRHSHATIYKCDMCNATFTTQSRIQMHKRIHVQKRPFSCEFCGAAFLMKSGLSGHLRAKPMVQNLDKHIPDLVCETCELTFISNCGKLKHREIIHSGDAGNSKKKCFQHSTSQENQSPREVVNVYYIDLGSILSGELGDKKIIKQEDANSDIIGILKELPSRLRGSEESTNGKNIKEEVQPFVPNNLASLEDGKYRENNINYENSGFWNITNL